MTRREFLKLGGLAAAGAIFPVSLFAPRLPISHERRLFSRKDWLLKRNANGLPLFLNFENGSWELVKHIIYNDPIFLNKNKEILSNGKDLPSNLRLGDFFWFYYGLAQEKLFKIFPKVPDFAKIDVAILLMMGVYSPFNDNADIDNQAILDVVPVVYPVDREYFRGHDDAWKQTGKGTDRFLHWLLHLVNNRIFYWLTEPESGIVYNTPLGFSVLLEAGTSDFSEVTKRLTVTVGEIWEKKETAKGLVNFFTSNKNRFKLERTGDFDPEKMEDLWANELGWKTAEILRVEGNIEKVKKLLNSDAVNLPHKK